MSAETAPAAIAYDIKTAIGGVVDRINNRVSALIPGKSWKLAKAPTKRAQMPRTLRKSWDQRLDERKKLEMVKTLQKEMKDEKKADKDVRFRKRQITLERQKIKEEKERLEQLAAKMSANKLKRLKKRQGNKKGK
ncbi:Cgr1 family-domain-containing protein [Jimgerdemannia flammicorona]|uniref:rRNA-processing protein n=1 Tax=Jimgerdemannia flammicorona TaxID=994334 RepID=A0A433Q4K6_9FUNG|nr:Cgr1 family-domain-containing protein [Jimgerdemannia flammicorona]